MSYRLKIFLLICVGFLAFFAQGVRQLSSAGDHSSYVAVVLSSVIYVGCIFMCVFLVRALERVPDAGWQFAAIMISAALVSLALLTLRSALPSGSSVRQMLRDLPKLAIVVPLMWIVRQEKRAQNG